MGTQKSEEIRIGSWNVQRGLFRREAEIRDLANQFDLFVLTETDTTTNTYFIPGFKTFFPSTNNKTRVLILVKDWLAPHVQLMEDLMTPNFSSIWLKISTAILGKAFNFCAIYREWSSEGDNSHSSQLDRINTFLQQVEKASSGDDGIIIVGDINLCSKRWDSHNYAHKLLSDRWREGMAKSGIEMLDLGLTYFSNHASQAGVFAESALDHIYTNCPERVIETKTLSNSGTDHLPISMNFKCNKKPTKSTILKRTFKNFNSKAFCKDLAMAPWEEIWKAEDVNQMVEMYSGFVNEALDTHAPIKEIKIKANYKSGLSKETKKLMNKRDTLRKEFSKTKGREKTVLHEKYKKLRNHCTKMIRKESISNSVRRVEKSKSASEIWKIANEIGKPNGNNDIILEANGNVISDKMEVAENFNKFFINKIKKLREKLLNSPKSDPLDKLKKQMNKRNLHFKLRTITANQVRKIIKKLKNTNSTGSDTISTKIIKEAREVLVEPITCIVNKSILSGIFPDMWKLAKVVPLLKKGNPKSIENYRPVSILNVTSKILEEAVRHQVSKFFETHKLFPKNQHGFRPNRSTTTALVALQDHLLKNKAQGKTTGMLLWDLSAAFDTLDHEIFLDKLKIYGFDKLSVTWFRSYLSNRKQKVQVGSQESEEERLTWGTPQGAILSPLIFTIYIADVELWTEFANIFGYADDTSTTISDTNEEIVLNKLQTESKNILNFMSSNGLVANPSKTGLQIFRPVHQKKGNISLEIGGARVHEANEEKLLGVTIENNLKWHSHVQKVQATLNQRVALLRRLKQWLPSNSLTQIAQGLIFSKIRYGLPVYGQPRLDEADPLSGRCQSLQITINNVMRIITSSSLKDKISVRDLHASTGLPSLNQMAVQSILMETWKMVQNDEISPFKMVGGRTRAASAGDLIVPNYKIGFRYHGTRLWNKAPQELRQAPTKDTAKSIIRNFSSKFL